MSMKKVSFKVKQGLRRTLSKGSFRREREEDRKNEESKSEEPKKAESGEKEREAEDELDEEKPRKFVFPKLLVNTPDRKWHVLITGGSGHLALHLVAKIIRDIKEELDILSEEDIKNQVTSLNIKKILRAPELRSPEDFMIAQHLQIELVDLVEPDRAMVDNSFITFHKFSFTNEKGMRSALEGVDTIFHLAAVGMTGKYAHDRKACMDINTLGTSNLLIWARELKIQRFIYSSSIGVVFDGNPVSNLREAFDYPADYYNVYCESKAHAERCVRQASCQELKTAILRFNGIYGPGEKRVTQRVADIIMAGWWLAIAKTDGVEAQTQLSSVKNCVQGLMRAECALRLFDAPHGQVYNIMDSKAHGTFSFWLPLAAALGSSGKLFEISAPFLRKIGWLSQTICDIFKIDPLITLLEVDLLLVNNTYSLKKARREIGYEPIKDDIRNTCRVYEAAIGPDFFRSQRQQLHFYRLVAVLLVILIGCFFSFFYCAYIFFGFIQSGCNNHNPA